MENVHDQVTLDGIVTSNGIFDGARLGAEPEEPRYHISATGVELSARPGWGELRKLHVSWYDIALLSAGVRLEPAEDTRFEHFRQEGSWVPRWTMRKTEVEVEQTEAAEWLRIGLRERWVTDLQVFRYRMAGRLFAAARWSARLFAQAARWFSLSRGEAASLRATLRLERASREDTEKRLSEARLELFRAERVLKMLSASPPPPPEEDEDDQVDA